MHVYLIAICVIITFIIIYNLFVWNTSAYEDYLYGFWVAEGDEFCEQSEIDSMLLFIGEPENGYFSKSRTCYLIIMTDMCNQGLTITYRSGWAGIGVGRYRINATAKFDEEQIWDDDITITVDMRDGTLKIKNNDGTVYAVLNKQHDTTNIARSMEDAELVDTD